MHQSEGNEYFGAVACPSCQLQWCFQCHAPAHGALTCRQYKKGDHLLRNWARARTHGQQNAQKCPKCKIYIERTTGCDHMHCTSCSTDFCYKCGEKYRYLKFFGDHYSKLSIFGCKYRFKANQPFQRRAIRGAVFGGTLIAVTVLALCAGVLVAGISLIALPVCVFHQLFRCCKCPHSEEARSPSPPVNDVPNVGLKRSQTFP
ncbi:probable E3 ubiquitin-protein ligase RNF217 [Nephila pilipes]|uniref:Probable E3 ubiquitin-protein ligase RNF217 n=1 Tax=Nephila pilipes TaxID=299642 RepID=A0A8X6TVT1_NEPPI|nr:probable E3 ubiquitin-protein ligase RNF217 [Nephila pilipes]